MSRDEFDARRVLTDVKANLSKLDGCPRHNFVRLGLGIGSKFRCTVCEGTIDAVAFKWYMRGIADAGNLFK